MKARCSTFLPRICVFEDTIKPTVRNFEKTVVSAYRSCAKVVPDETTTTVSNCAIKSLYDFSSSSVEGLGII